MSIALPLKISNFSDGVAESPHAGFGMIKNADIESFPPAIKVQKKLVSQFLPIATGTFTADAGSNICTGPILHSSIDYTGYVVQLTTTGNLPGNLSINTNYFLIKVSLFEFKLATTRTNAIAGTAIDITSAGDGIHTITQLAVGTVNYIVKDPRSGYYYALDSNGRVWVLGMGRDYFWLLDGNTRTGTATDSNGLCLFTTTNYTWLFVFRSLKIDVINVFGDTQLATPVWYTDWKSMNSGNRHHAIVGQDNIIYYTDGKYIGSIKEVSSTPLFEDTGNPTTSSSTTNYNFNYQALDFPRYEIAKHLEELGTNLLIAGGIYNKIYPWNRISDSFSLPLDVPEVGVYRLKNIGNIVYILAGTKGNIYKTQGIDVKFFKKIPEYLTNNGGGIISNPITWGGIGARSGALLVGVDANGSGMISNSGVYIIYPDGRLVQDNTTNCSNTSAPFNIASSIYAENEFYFVGYNGGIDKVDGSSLYSPYETIIQTALYPVGNKTEKASYTDLELQMAKISANGAAHVRVSYRFDESSSWTVMDNATFTADGVATSFNSDVGLIDIENIQLQIEMDGTFELISLTLSP